MHKMVMLFLCGFWNALAVQPASKKQQAPTGRWKGKHGHRAPCNTLGTKATQREPLGEDSPVPQAVSLAQARPGPVREAVLQAGKPTAQQIQPSSCSSQVCCWLNLLVARAESEDGKVSISLAHPTARGSVCSVSQGSLRDLCWCYCCVWKPFQTNACDPPINLVFWISVMGCGPKAIHIFIPSGFFCHVCKSIKKGKDAYVSIFFGSLPWTGKAVVFFSCCYKSKRVDMKILRCPYL